MSVKKSPQLVKSKVVGARLTPNEIAWLDIVRGNEAPGTYVARLVREARDRWTKEQPDTTR